MLTEPEAKKKIEEILHELYARAGFDAWWDEIQPSTKAEIKKTLRQILTKP